MTKVPGEIRKCKNLNILYQNVRGIKTKLSTWRNNLSLLDHDIVAATETFLDSSVGDMEVSSYDWSVLRRDRGTPCGGVLIAARAPILLRRRPELETTDGEDLWASFTWRGRAMYVCVVYIKPSAKDADYMKWFTKIEAFINSVKGIVLILGDLNLNSSSLTIRNYFCYFMSFCGLNEKNNLKNLHGGVLDVALFRESEEVQDVIITATEGIVYPDAYHPPLDIQVRIDTVHGSNLTEPSNIDISRDWNFKKCNYDLLSSLLAEQSWDCVTMSDNIHEATQNFYITLYKLFDICVSKNRRQKGKNRLYPVWFTKDIIQDIRRKSRLHSAWKRTGCAEAYRNFSDIRANLKIRVKSSYEIYMKRIGAEIKTNPREFWRHISNLRSKGGFEPTVTHKGESLTGIQAAEAFASFFSSVFLPDIPLLDTGQALGNKNSNNSNHISITNITPKNVLYGINKLKASSSIGPDGIPSAVLKRGKKYLCQPLHHILNLALKTGVYPPQWKVSRVVPIPKSAQKAVVDEYRPIAILSAPAKVFETILHNYIYSQIDKHLCDEQHGFRPKRSVNTNLLILVEFISASLDQRDQVDVVYFDFKKAFDRVNNDVLLLKLNLIGFDPGLLSLLADYLKDRQQYVKLGFYESKPYHTRSGVSQGSILGPLLFLIMINDLPAVIKHSKCLLYADDLKLYRVIKSQSDCEALQVDIDALCNWAVENRMEFNSSKCLAMTFGRMRQPICYNYQLDGVEITKTFSVKDLGVTFDPGLTFHDHILATAKDSFCRLGFILRNVKDFHNISVVKTIYNALVRSKLETSAAVWNPYESTYILLLEKVQKAFLRFLYKQLHGYYPFMYPTKFLLGTLGYNSLEVRRNCDQIGTMCKILHGKILATELHEKLTRLFVPNNYCRSRKHKLFAVPACRTVARANSPIPRSLAALNALLDGTDCDIFADEWKKILSVCLKYCEKSV